MKSSIFFILLLILTAGIVVDNSEAANIFTYQGRLMDDDIPADGQYDLAFTLFDSPDADIDSAVTHEEIFHEHLVNDGYFTVNLDFSPFGDFSEADIFDGSPRWLKIGIRPGQLEDPNEYTYLEPLTKLTAAPYAHLAHRLQTPAVLRNETTEPVLTIANEGDGPELLMDGNGNIRYLDDALTEIFGDYSISVGNSQTRTIGTNAETTITLTRTTAIGASDQTEIGAARVTNIGSYDRTTVGADSSTSAGKNIQMLAGENISMAADDLIKMQNKVSISNDPNDLLKVNGAISLEPMDPPPLTTGYGKLFVNNTDGKIYFLDSDGNLYDLTAVKSDRVSFSVKRDVSYAWPTSSSFENVDFAADTTILDNTGLGFNHKSGAFIAPADGLYTFHGAIFFTSLGKGDQISAAINAAGTRYCADMTSTAGGEETVRASITLYLNEDDQVTLQGYVSAAATVNVFGNLDSTEVFTYFTGARVD